MVVTPRHTFRATPTGNQGVNGTLYVNVESTLPFDRVIARSTSYAFEFDNVSYGNSPRSVPAPDAASFIGVGLLATGLLAHRTMKRKATRARLRRTGLSHGPHVTSPQSLRHCGGFVRISQINLVVGDMDASVRFYRLLGLDVPDTNPEWQQHHRSATLPGGVDLDLDSIVFARKWNAGASGRVGGGNVITFAMETRADVDAVHARMVDAGYRSSQAPYDAFWGARFAIVDDPDGNPVGLMSPSDAAFRSYEPPPAS